MKKLIALMVVILISCPGLSLAGEGHSEGGSASQASSVKGSKSNSSDRSMNAEDPAKKDETGVSGPSGIAVTDEGAPANQPNSSRGMNSIRNMPAK